jgi:hypothetical protein
MKSFMSMGLVVTTAIASGALAFGGATLRMNGRVEKLEAALATSEARIAALEHPALSIPGSLHNQPGIGKLIGPR